MADYILQVPANSSGIVIDGIYFTASGNSGYSAVNVVQSVDIEVNNCNMTWTDNLVGSGTVGILVEDCPTFFASGNCIETEIDGQHELHGISIINASGISASGTLTHNELYGGMRRYFNLSFVDSAEVNYNRCDQKHNPTSEADWAINVSEIQAGDTLVAHNNIFNVKSSANKGVVHIDYTGATTRLGGSHFYNNDISAMGGDGYGVYFYNLQGGSNHKFRNNILTNCKYGMYKDSTGAPNNFDLAYNASYDHTFTAYYNILGSPFIGDITSDPQLKIYKEEFPLGSDPYSVQFMWRIDEGTGSTVVQEKSGYSPEYNAIFGVRTSGGSISTPDSTKWEEGRFPGFTKALRFGGSASTCLFVYSWGSFAEPLNLKSQSYTMSFWVKPEDYGSNQNLISKIYSVSQGYRFDILSTGALYHVHSGTDDLSTAAGTFTWDGDWHQIVATVDLATDTKKIFLDGVKVGEVTGTGWDPYGGQYDTCSIGAYLYNNSGSIANHFKGLMGDVVIFDNALSESEVAALYGQTADMHLVATSPCIDAGDPSYEYSNEPVPDGTRVNIGAYGNTDEATPGGAELFVSKTGSNTPPYDTQATAANEVYDAFDYGVANIGTPIFITILDEGSYSGFARENHPYGVTITNYNGQRPSIGTINFRYSEAPFYKIKISGLDVNGQFIARNYQGNVELYNTNFGSGNVDLLGVKGLTVQNCLFNNAQSDAHALKATAGGDSATPLAYLYNNTFDGSGSLGDCINIVGMDVEAKNNIVVNGSGGINVHEGIVPSGNLLIYSNFDEGTGTTASDESGNGNDGTLSLDQWRTGYLGNSVYMDGNTVTYPTLTSLQSASGMAVSMWVYLDAWVPTTYDTIGLFRTNGAGVGGVNLFLNSQWDTANHRFFELNWYDNTGAQQGYYRVNPGEPTMQESTWNHIVFVYDAGTMYIYLNGVQYTLSYESGSGIGSTLPSTVGPFVLTSSNDGLHRVDKLRVFDVALTEDQVREIYGAGYPAGYTSLYNDVWNNTTNYVGVAASGTGDFSADPLFVSTTDWHIQKESPCCDTGYPGDDVGPEPSGGHGRINVGRYGGTDEATFDDQAPENVSGLSLSQQAVPNQYDLKIDWTNPTLDWTKTRILRRFVQSDLDSPGRYPLTYDEHLTDPYNDLDGTGTKLIYDASTDETYTDVDVLQHASFLNYGYVYYMAFTKDDVGNWSVGTGALFYAPPPVTVSFVNPIGLPVAFGIIDLEAQMSENDEDLEKYVTSSFKIDDGRIGTLSWDSSEELFIGSLNTAAYANGVHRLYSLFNYNDGVSSYSGLTYTDINIQNPNYNAIGKGKYLSGNALRGVQGGVTKNGTTTLASTYGQRNLSLRPRSTRK